MDKISLVNITIRDLELYLDNCPLWPREAGSIWLHNEELIEYIEEPNEEVTDLTFGDPEFELEQNSRQYVKVCFFIANF